MSIMLSFVVSVAAGLFVELIGRLFGGNDK